MPLKNSIPEKKKPSLKRLMQEQFFAAWMEDPSLSWHRDILVSENQVVNQEEEEEQECDCLEPDHGVHI